MTASRNKRDVPCTRDETAVLFADMQRIFCIPGDDPAHSALDETHDCFRRLAATTIPNQQRILSAARANGVQMLHTLIEALTADCRDASLDHKLSGLLVPKGHPLAPPIDELMPGPNEIAFPKTSSGVFNPTNTDDVLKNLGIGYLTAASVVTDQCVDMADRGHLVSLPEDACATHTQERHDAALRAFAGYCWVNDSESVVGCLNAIQRKVA
jgi:nicotinamidase-related amidase